MHNWKTSGWDISAFQLQFFREWGDLLIHFASSHSVTLIRKLQFRREVVWEHGVQYRWGGNTGGGRGRVFRFLHLGNLRTRWGVPRSCGWKGHSPTQVLSQSPVMHFCYLAKLQQFSLPFKGKETRVLCFYLESRAHHFPNTVFAGSA